MRPEYPFTGRESEISSLRASFTTNVLRERRCLAHLVQGRRGVGKTRLMTEFIRSIQDDVLLHSDIAAFRVDRHVMTYDCATSQGQPYEPFKAITDLINAEQRMILLATEIVYLLLSVFNVDTILGHLKSIGALLLHKRDQTGQPEKETRLFNRYRRLLVMLNKKAPLVIFLQNVQCIDAQSLKLIQKLIRDPRPFWGMIVLEDQQDFVGNKEIHDSLTAMVMNGDLTRLVVHALGREFPAQLLGQVFPPDLFDGGEYEVMYAISEGCPGILIEEVEAWKRSGWLTTTGQRIQKCADFKEKIKPKSQKLLELVVALFEDRILTEGEERLIYRMAAEWGIADDAVAQTVAMVRDISGCNYKIVRRIGPGIIAPDSFEALNESGTHFIIEFVLNMKHLPVNSRRLGVVHSNLLETHEIRPCGDGILLCWDYREGRRIREIMREAHETQVKRAVALLKQITPALAEIHRVGGAHGYIQPESIIETTDGRFCLASIDPALMAVVLPAMRPDRETMLFVAPEVLNGGVPDARSDIYSLGVLLYNLLSNRFPFEGPTREEIIQAIKKGLRTPGDEKWNTVPTDLQRIIGRCLEYYPENRYHHASELLGDLNSVDPEANRPPVVAPPAPATHPPRSRSRVLRFIPVTLLGVAVIGAGIWYLLHLRTGQARVIPAITVRISEGESTARVKLPLSARVAQFLLVDDLSQSSDQVVYSETIFQRIYASTERSVPRLTVRGEISTSDLEYTLHLQYESADGGANDTVFSFHDPSSLLNDISRITRDILAHVNVTTLKPSRFTHSWDAFESFYAGDTAWRRLDVTRATESFENALAIDSTFVLAMVRLADVYRFNGQRDAALGLLHRAAPMLAELSTADSLRAEALTCRLTGRLWEAVGIYRRIADLMPGRRSVLYDLAEGYYQLREAEQATQSYRLALAIDPSFAPAYNHLGYCYAHQGLHDSALACLRTYLRLDRSANAFDSMGDGFFAAGMLDSATAAKMAGIALDPQLGYLYSSLAYICIRAGEMNAAEEKIIAYEKYAAGHRDLEATAYAVRGYYNAVRGDLPAGVQACRAGLRAFDSEEIESRNHQLHWTLGILSLRTGRPEVARDELKAMNAIIAREAVSSKRYNEVLKFALHLEAAIDAASHQRAGIDKAAAAFDGALRTKVKDGGSSFDLAYLNTSLGEMYLGLTPALRTEAMERFGKALEYNPRYPTALFRCAALLDQLDRRDEAQRQRELLQQVRAHADAGAPFE